MKVKPKTLIPVLLVIAVLVWYNNPEDAARAELVNGVYLPREASLSRQAGLYGRGLALDLSGEGCQGSSGCHTCDADVEPTYFTATGLQQEYANDHEFSIAWQVFHIEPNGAWTNLCDAAAANTGAPQTDCQYTTGGSRWGFRTGGAKWLGARWTNFLGNTLSRSGSYDVVVGERYAQKIFFCNLAAPQSCADSDSGTVFSNLEAQYKQTGQVTVRLADGTQNTYQDDCIANTNLLNERVCGTTATAQTDTIDCSAAIGPSWTCSNGACIDSTIGDGTGDGTGGNTDPAAVSASGGLAIQDRNNQNNYLVKNSEGTMISLPKKPITTMSDLNNIGGPETWYQSTSPVCTAIQGDEVCQEGGRCLQASKPNCGTLQKLIGSDCAKSDAEKVYAVLHDKSANGATLGTLIGGLTGAGIVVGAGAALTSVAGVLLVPGIGPLLGGAIIAGALAGRTIGSLIDDATITKFGVCLPKPAGILQLILQAIADALGVSTGTAGLILVGGAFVILLLILMPRRN